MLGALAWQATTVIKMILVSWREIARGLFYFSPGFSPLCVWCPLLCACRHNRFVVLAQRSTVANSSWSFRPNIKACTAVPWFVWRLYEEAWLSSFWPVWSIFCC